MDKVRESALKALYKIEKDGAYSNIILDDTINRNRDIFNDKDIGFISELVYGVTTWRLTLDEIIKKHSKIKLKKISVWIINILRMGIYQIVFLDKVPKSAAVNESVNLAKKYGHKGSYGFVNAILRNVEKSDYESLFEIEDSVQRISKTTSIPEWIVKKLIDERGEKETEVICNNSNLKPELSIRVNNLKTNIQELKKSLTKKNIEFIEVEEKDFLILKKIKNIENIDLFKNGLFTVQDLSAGMVSKVLDPKPGECILDCCSAPGGKTTYIAEIMENKGNIEAWDIYEHRIKLVKQNADRLGINIIKTKVKDATVYDDSLNEKYDKILLDVPCLGLGVMKRKPDIKWQRKEEDIEEINKIQSEIINICSKYLKKGGNLVYSTCSILKHENENIINQFLNQNNNFIIEQKININPDRKHDGFFICNLKKM